MKEMVGGCCVCSDERGFFENPLVYCDGQGCNVAVHQACYGIVQVPTGPWFCRKCESQERAARVRCELCPTKDGALKRTDNTGWAHVVCALYIPEVRFGNNNTMEPIILALVPPERFNKVCSLCEEQGKESKAKIGACMQCNKLGCKTFFHVTCAQAAGLLCEEAGNNMDNVKYCGYCRHHKQKLEGANIKQIPAFKPIPNDNATPESSPDKLTSPPRLLITQVHHNETTKLIPKKKSNKSNSISSNNSIASPSGSTNSNSNAGSNKIDLSKVKSENPDEATLNKTIEVGFDKSEKMKKKSVGSTSASPQITRPEPAIAISNSSNSIMHNDAKSSPNPTPSFTSLYGSLTLGTNSDDKSIESKSTNLQTVRRKIDGNEKKRVKKTENGAPKPIKTKSAAKHFDSVPPVKKPRKKKELPSVNGMMSIPVNQPNMTPLQNGYMQSSVKPFYHVPSNSLNGLPGTSILTPTVKSTTSSSPSPTSSKMFPPKNDSDPQTLEQLLERQWAQGSQFIVDQAQHFDIASLLSCLHQLRSENNRLEERVHELVARRDHLLAVNARLALPPNNVFPINGAFTSNSINSNSNQSPPANPGANQSFSNVIQSSLQTNSPKGICASSPGQSPARFPFQNNDLTVQSHNTSHLFNPNISSSFNLTSSSSPISTSALSHSQYVSISSHQNAAKKGGSNGVDKR